MIAGIQLLQSIGQFDHVPAGAIDFARYVLVYAENGRGKTTLSAVLRSLATADPVPIVERSRLGANRPPNVVVNCRSGITPAVFANGNWNRQFAEIAVFDDDFVDQNLYSGVNVELGHRQKLHDLILGSRGVDLNRRLRELVDRVEQHNAELRARAAVITDAIRGPFSVDEFCALPRADGLEQQIGQLERELAAAEHAATIRGAQRFSPLRLPAFDLGNIRHILATTLADLDVVAVERVRQHFTNIGPEAETWVRSGMGRVSHTADGHEACPFCAQVLDGSELLRLYRSYFGAEYAALNNSIAEALTNFDRSYPETAGAQLERTLRVAGELQHFWSRFMEVRQIEFQTEDAINAWETVRSGLRRQLVAKIASPLSAMEIPREVNESYNSLQPYFALIAGINEYLEATNLQIVEMQQRVGAEALGILRDRLSRIQAAHKRRQPSNVALCDAYIAERDAKETTEQLRTGVREELEQHRIAEFPLYENSINGYLQRFNAGFRLGNVEPIDNRGGAACNYQIMIREWPVRVAGGNPVPGEPSFKSTLSAGDRTTLAFAFYLSSLDRDPAPASRIAVIDDPIASLDEHRAMSTVQEIQRLGRRLAQVIVLSHDKPFLLRIWTHLAGENPTTVRIDRDGDGSSIAPWDAQSDLLSDHARNHALVRSYVANGPRNNGRDVAIALRLILEGFLRSAYPGEYPPGPGAMGGFREICRQRVDGDRGVLSRDDLDELDLLLQYANQFHHDTNPGWQHAAVNDAELNGYAQRVLRFAARPRA
ncbi:MAG: AAA family ATPase [Candidatus Acidiferrales bacterium]